MSTMEEYLNSLNLTSLKAIIKYHNLHQKIKMTGKREELIKRLLDHYDTVTNGNLRSKIFMTPQFDLPTPKRKPRVKKDEVIKIDSNIDIEKKSKDERMKTLLSSLNSIRSKKIEDDIAKDKALYERRKMIFAKEHRISRRQFDEGVKKDAEKPRQTKEERDSITARNEIKTAMKLIEAKDERMKTGLSFLNAIRSKKKEDDIVISRAQEELQALREKKAQKALEAKAERMKPGLSFLNAIRSKKKEDDRVIKNARDNITFKRFRSDVSKISMKAKEKNEKYIDTFIYQLRNLNADASYEDKKRFIYMHLSQIYYVAKRLALTYDKDKLLSKWNKIQDYLQASRNNIITPNTIDWVYKNILISAKKKLKPITKITKEDIKEFNKKIKDNIKQTRDIIKGTIFKQYIY